jgi:GAF domain-containing protein
MAIPAIVGGLPMSASTTRAAVGPGPEPDRLRRENATLYAVINTVASSLDLPTVLDGVVDIATEATGCHACFIYAVEEGRLVLRAASPRYRRLAGAVSLGLDEGLAGWVVRHRRPAFIRDNALDDPRMAYVPELEEERFQSMVAVPVPARSGDPLGVIVLHTEAPREFDDEVLNLLVHVASLVAGAFENATLYQATRRQLERQRAAAQLSQALAAATTPDEVHRAAAAGARELLGGAAVLLRFDDAGADLRPVAASPPEALPAGPIAAARLLLDLVRLGPGEAVPTAATRALLDALGPAYAGGALHAVPVSSAGEHLGVLAVASSAPRAFTADEAEALRAAASQAAVALRKAELIDRLTVEHAVRSLVQAVESGREEDALRHAHATGVDLDAPQLAVRALPAPRPAAGAPGWPEGAGQLARALRTLAPGAAVDRRPQAVVALLPSGAVRADALARIGTAARAAGASAAVAEAGGGAGGAVRGLAEAGDALRIAAVLAPEGGAVHYDELGAYRYLAHLAAAGGPRDRQWRAASALAARDAARGSDLLGTLERYLGGREGIAPTARALFIHPNTLRQRLRRIERITGMDLGSEDLLALELAVKLVRLQRAGALGGAPGQIPGRE